MSRDITVSDLDIMTSAINYRSWIFDQIAQYVGKRVLEIGAGIGNYTEFILDCDLVICLDNHIHAISTLCQRFSAKPNIMVYEGDIADNNVCSLAKYRCDTALCLNVLEHVKNDVGALENVANILAPGGYLLLVVPAVPAIMGSVDQSLGHYRRYTPTSLRKALYKTGWRIEQMKYMNLLGIFGWLWNNKIIRRREESASQMIFYDKVIVPWLSVVERILTPPVGLSLVCMATH